MKFLPDYRNIEDAAYNRKPKRIPLYEHSIDVTIMERISGEKFSHLINSDVKEYFRKYNNFFLSQGYDTVTYEACITPVLPYGGALGKSVAGYIDSPERLKSYPWKKAKDIYIDFYARQFDALTASIPEGMKLIGGVGNGAFEIAQDLVGYQDLAVMPYDDKAMYREIFDKIGDMMLDIWEWFMERYSEYFCVVRFGDDLGFKSNTLLPHDDIRECILPQYKKVIDFVHRFNKPFLLHSCGCIFDVMDDIVATGINAKHSNEDQIALMEEWVKRYGGKIGNFGGVDTDHLVRMDNATLVGFVKNIYALAESKDGGFAIGSGNSIPEYVNPEKYLLMVNTVRKLRGDFDL